MPNKSLIQTRSIGTLLGAVGGALLASFSIVESANAFDLKASVALSQFGTPETVIYNSDEPIFSGPPITAYRENSDGTTKVSASASPRELNGTFEVKANGIATPFAEASLWNAGIVFRNLQPLQQLINPTQKYIDLALNFHVSYYLETESEPGLWKQSTSHVYVNFSSRYAFDLLGGGASSLNFPDKHEFNNYGVFAGLPEQGGSVIAKLPLRIHSFSLNNPYNLNERGEFVVPFVASANVSGLALSDGYSKGRVTVEIPDLTYFLTTADGSSVKDLGVDFNLLPEVSATSVPTPVLLPSLVAFSLRIFRRHKLCDSAVLT
jgi:hypothetical protein